MHPGRGTADPARTPRARHQAQSGREILSGARSHPPSRTPKSRTHRPQRRGKDHEPLPQCFSTVGRTHCPQSAGRTGCTIGRRALARRRPVAGGRSAQGLAVGRVSKRKRTEQRGFAPCAPVPLCAQSFPRRRFYPAWTPVQPSSASSMWSALSCTCSLKDLRPRVLGKDRQSTTSS